MASAPRPRRIPGGFRTKLIGASVVFFVLALILSSAFLFFGQNTISGNNIAIDVSAPFAIGGGETLSLQVGVTNRNSVTVESATLIVEYPAGTQAADGSARELFRERVALDDIAPGEVLNIPLSARIFGEENEEKLIGISVEYRIEGSNATFFKEADMVRVKVSSSPVSLIVDAVSEISSGQEVEFTLTLASNSPAALTNLLVQASYPQGFDFSSAEPAPVKGQNIWSIDELAPGEELEIVVRGVMMGASAEERTFRFQVGVPAERDRFSLASVLTAVEVPIALTNPFVGLQVEVNGQTDETVSVSRSEQVDVEISFENTLGDTIYDGEIQAVLSGSGLSTQNVDVSGGFFNSSTRTITWSGDQVRGLRTLAPGEREQVRFTIRGAAVDATRTPQISFNVSVAGRRVSESSVPQTLTNVAIRTIRFETVASISSHALHSIGPFTNDGPVPPRAEQVTEYAIMLAATNGSNALADAVVTLSLPAYIMWRDTVTAGDEVSYNTATREVSWRIGTLEAGASANAAFQVSFLPSVSQVGTVPTIASEQRLRATDRFTGTVVRATASALTTRLSEDPDQDAQRGYVEE